MKPQSPTYVEIARGDNPEAALYAIVGLRQLADILERRQVTAAREQGWTWDQIAHILGVSRQAVAKRLRGDA
jgi:transcriptional regulator of acetoin/glycerol metabolism